MNFIKKNVPGMLLCLLIAIPAWYLGKLFPVVGGSVLAILIGLLVAMVPRRPALQSGIGFTSKKVLQYAIVLLGFDMNLFHILQVGRQSLLIIVVTISTALIVAYLVSLPLRSSMRMMRMWQNPSPRFFSLTYWPHFSFPPPAWRLA